tara:strand:+ start:1946 stop:4234 length:2289 start_codon:yes stop_codon:yes gene_type:complete
LDSYLAEKTFQEVINSVGSDCQIKPLTAEARDASYKWLPVVLNAPSHPSIKRKTYLLLTETSESCPLGGGKVYVVSTHSPGVSGTGSPMSPQTATILFASLKVWTPGHVGAASPEIASIMWRARATFKNLSWETVNQAELKAVLDRGAPHIDIVPLVLPPVPLHILKDLHTLPIDDANDKEGAKQALSTWAAKGEYWTPPDGKWPCYPVAQHDPRSAKLGSRGDLVAAAMAMLRAPISHSTVAAFPTLNLMSKGLLKLNAVQPAPTNTVAPAADDDDDDEAAETAALCAPPPSKKKPTPAPAPPKLNKKAEKQLKVNAAAFVKGARGIANSDDDSMSEGEPGEDEGQESEDGFIASDDDVEEAGSTASARQKREKKQSRKRKERFEKNVVSDQEDGSERSSESSSAEEMSEGSGSDNDSDGSDGSDDDVVVKARKDASDADGMDSDDDDDEGAVSTHKRLKKTSDIVRGASANPPKKKKAKIVDDDNEGARDGENAPPPSALLAQQRLSGERSAGSKPLPKMGASQGRIDKALESRHPLASFGTAKPPQPRGTPAVEEPEALFTPTKGKSADVSQPADAANIPSAPGAPNRASRDLMRKARSDKLAEWTKISNRVCNLMGPVIDGEITNKGSVLCLAPNGINSFSSAMTVANHRFSSLVDDNTIPGSWHPIVSASLSVIDSLVGIIEAADGDEKTRKKNDSANADLGCIAAQSLVKVVPQIEALQKTIAEASAQINGLVGTSAGMASRLTQAAAKKAALDNK